MRILVLGQGKTGSLVAQVAKDRGHNVRSLASQQNQGGRGLEPDVLNDSDVVVDFTTPQAVVVNISRCVEASVPLVVGTTGWYQHLSQVRQMVGERQAAFLYGSNFSLGMIFFFRAVQAIGPILKHDYRAHIVERHHAQKKDKPSGTAVTLEKILESASGRQVEVSSVREGDIVGTHIVELDSAYDGMRLTHDAKSRLGFATGAVRAAEWIRGRIGFYEFQEIVDQL